MEIKGMKELNIDLDRLDDVARNKVKDIIQTRGLYIQRDAKRDAPLQYGRLRNSITPVAEDNRFTSVVYSDVEYAPFQEFGTVKMGAQPFMMPAFERHSERVIQDIDKELKL